MAFSHPNGSIVLDLEILRAWLGRRSGRARLAPFRSIRSRVGIEGNEGGVSGQGCEDTGGHQACALHSMHRGVLRARGKCFRVVLSWA